MLWDKGELENSEYGVGSAITDHFEVVERGNDKVLYPPPPCLLIVVCSALIDSVAMCNLGDYQMW